MVLQRHTVPHEDCCWTCPPADLEKVLYFVAFVVTDPGDTPLEYKQLLTDVEYRQAQRDYGAKSFKAGMGAEAIKELLQQLDLEKTEKELREEIARFRRTEDA